jgi:hypothetical protein
MVQIKTAELSGVALDWAVAQTFKPGSYWESQEFLDSFHPSTDWSQGGPIIVKEGISINKIGFSLDGDIWEADFNNFAEEGATPLVAAMRCYVASKFGDTVDIPEELMFILS